MLREAGVDPAAAGVRLVRAMDLRHKGQGYELTVEIPDEVFERGSVEALAAFFYERYKDKYGHAHTNLPVELITCRASLAGPPPVVPAQAGTAVEGAPPRKRVRPVYFPEAGGYVETAVYDRYRLSAPAAFDGPAVIEERECTIIAGPSSTVRVDAAGNLFIDVRTAPAPLTGARVKTGRAVS
jgi:N-methylhydantoinase A